MSMGHGAPNSTDQCRPEPGYYSDRGVQSVRAATARCRGAKEAEALVSCLRLTAERMYKMSICAVYTRAL
jgi:hypothetical protein